MAGIGEQPRISAPIGAEPGHREVGQRLLEGRELGAAEVASGVLARRLAERGIDADQVVRLGPALEPLRLGGSGSGSVLALRIFLAMASASSVRLMRDMSEGSDLHILLVPSRRLMTRVAGPGSAARAAGKKSSP